MEIHCLVKKLLLCIIEAMKCEYRGHLLYLHDGTMDLDMEEMGEDGLELLTIISPLFKNHDTGDIPHMLFWKKPSAS